MNQTTRTILDGNNFTILSTVSEAGVPWGTPVHMAFDEQHIYWISADSSVHSQNIAANGKVFLVVFNPAQDTSKETRAALYISTTARALEGDEATAAHDNVYAKRFTTSHLPKGGAHIYAAPIGVLNEAKTKDQMQYYVGGDA
jgi:nitroimidazol reductase NimA-like FMN-containing flavoprotein (pyridoxamine 5'-phosphate oxidase superfamily)